MGYRTSLRSMVQGSILCQQAEGKSPHTVEYYKGVLHRLLWYANKEGWPEEVQLVCEWHVRDFLGYVTRPDRIALLIAIATVINIVTPEYYYFILILV